MTAAHVSPLDGQECVCPVVNDKGTICGGLVKDAGSVGSAASRYDSRTERQSESDAVGREARAGCPNASKSPREASAAATVSEPCPQTLPHGSHEWGHVTRRSWCPGMPLPPADPQTPPAASSSVPTPAGNCPKCGGQMYALLTHFCTTSALPNKTQAWPVWTLPAYGVWRSL